MLQKNFDGAVASPECHYQWWKLCCDPKNGLVAIAAPRKHAKTTAITHTYTLACVLFRERNYVLIVSDTVAQAVQFLGDIKRELYDNETLRSLFKISEFVKDSEDDIIVSCEDGHMFRIQAKGSEQKVRGLKWNNKRPDLIVCDDLENDEIVMNKDRRDKFKRWFYGALLPCRSLNGIVRYMGTVLHADSLLEGLMPPKYSKNTVQTPLYDFSNTRVKGWVSIKYRAHTPTFDKLLWPAAHTREYFQDLRQNFIEQGLPEQYSQEYLNQPLDETLAYYKRNDFLPMDAEDKSLGEDNRLNYYITGDLAISEKETADFTVFVVAGVDEHKRLHIIDVIKDRLDGREIVDTILELERVYRPEAFGIEEMQVSRAIGPFLREEMVRTNTYPTLVQLKHGGKDKIARGRSMQARMRAHTVKFDKSKDWYQDFEDECCTFPRSKHDDQVDAFAYLGMMLDMVVNALTDEEQDEEDYEYERRESDAGDAGRNSFTGY